MLMETETGLLPQAGNWWPGQPL